MAPRKDRHDPGSAQLAELSALADGSLDPAQRPRVEEAIRSSPGLRDLYEREREAVEMLRQARAERAPARLHAQIEAQRTVRAAPRRWPIRYGALAAGVAAAAVIAVALVLPTGTPGSPSVAQAAQLAERGPTAPAPMADPGDPRIKLAQRVQDVYFPNWSSTRGWRAVGVRHDDLGGRGAVTVYYQLHGARVAYTIVDAPALAEPRAAVSQLAGVELRTLSLGGRTVVTWRRAGHTCVLSANSVPVRVLEALAAWRDGELSG